MKATHALSIYVHTGTPEQFQEVHDAFTKSLAVLGDRYPYAGMTSMLLDDEPVAEDCDHYFTEPETLEKARASIALALDMADITGYFPPTIKLDQLVELILQKMSTRGLLIMERR